ncbi:MAG: peptide ABC transporter ATP-binding protein [Planctomycetes bacterium RBG_16_43_13]|nr:MAG: peptide ABC transporter ATP-binding protein [Planctomycetes bacterium RBG_16_43_13]
MDNNILLSVEGLKTQFHTDDGTVKAVDGVSFSIKKGETLGLVGESGCGKSVTALSVMRLISQPGRVADGRISFDGVNLLDLPENEMRQVRGNKISMIFQEPMTSLNPVFTVGNQIIEAIILHQKKSKSEAREQTIEMLRKVKIPSPETRVDEYPHQLSGGMRQRVMIAMALSCNPKLLIADEPTTALDVTVQAQILDLLKDLQKEFGMSILIITHNLGVVADIADNVAVMYASKIVEYSSAKEIFGSPKHPYTGGLFKSVPRLGASKLEKLSVIPGVVPNPTRFPSGCKFHPRCPVAEARCKDTEPTLKETSPGHLASCLLLERK